MYAVPSTAVFNSSLISCFPGMLLKYFLNDFQMVPVAPIITGVTFVFAFHMRCISIIRSLHFRIFFAVVTPNNIYKLVFFILFVKILCNVDYLCFICCFNL
jgi:hypothetical protein